MTIELREDEIRELVQMVYDYCTENLPDVFDTDGLLQGYYANILNKIDPTWRDWFESNLYLDEDE